MTPEITVDDIVTKIAHGRGDEISAKEVFSLLDRYPFFALPAAQLVKHSPEALPAHQRELLTARVALSASNPAELYMVLSPDHDEHARFYPDEADKTPTTENAIDTFLQTYGSTSPEEEEILNRLIFNPTPDYSQVLAKEEEASAPSLSDAAPGSADDLINRFIINAKERDQQSGRGQSQPEANAAVDEVVSAEPAQAPGSPRPDAPAAVEDQAAAGPTAPMPDASLSESLARIFIKQRQYQRAYEIIEQLNLNFPEKSVYFADQLRFLRKLMLNQKLRAERNQS